MILIFAKAALASTWAPSAAGFAVESRDDAPTDAVISFLANFNPTATAAEGPNASASLQGDLHYGGQPDFVEFRAPLSGWTPGTGHVVQVLDYYEEDAPYTLAFSVIDAIAEPPAPFEITEVSIGSWGPEGNYNGLSCCKRTRRVEVSVTSDAADAWSRLELLGLDGARDRPNLHDAAFGTGSVVLAFEQWRDDDGVHPHGFQVEAVSASGARGGPVDVVLPGCATSPLAARWAPLAAVLVGAAIRRSRRRRGAAIVVSLLITSCVPSEEAPPCDLAVTAADLAGPGAVDCGHADMNVDGTAQWACAVDAFEAGTPFFLLKNSGVPIDSVVIDAVVSDGAQIWYLHQDHARGDPLQVDGNDCVAPFVETFRGHEYVADEVSGYEIATRRTGGLVRRGQRTPRTSPRASQPPPSATPVRVASSVSAQRSKEAASSGNTGASSRNVTNT